MDINVCSFLFCIYKRAWRRLGVVVVVVVKSFPNGISGDFLEQPKHVHASDDDIPALFRFLCRGQPSRWVLLLKDSKAIFNLKFKSPALVIISSMFFFLQRFVLGIVPNARKCLVSILKVKYVQMLALNLRVEWFRIVKTSLL